MTYSFQSLLGDSSVQSAMDYCGLHCVIGDIVRAAMLERDFDHF